jgi:hypothetical protein
MLTIRISKVFISGFLTGVILLVAINLYSYSQMKDLEIEDMLYEFGWPFPLYQSGTILHLTGELHWCGLVADLSVAIFAGILLGVICNLLFVRFERQPNS